MDPVAIMGMFRPSRGPAAGASVTDGPSSHPRDHPCVHFKATLSQGCSQRMTDTVGYENQPFPVWCGTSLPGSFGCRTPHLPGWNFLRTELQAEAFSLILLPGPSPFMVYDLQAVPASPASCSFPFTGVSLNASLAQIKPLLRGPELT